jgi:hypothetical protein
LESQTPAVPNATRIKSMKQSLKQSLSDELWELENKNLMSWITDDKYELPVTVWLGNLASWQGQREDTWSFYTQEAAERAATIIRTMLQQQNRTKNSVAVGQEELKWLDKLGGPEFLVLWKVGEVTHVMRKKCT